MAVVEKTVDIIGDAGFCDILIERRVPEGYPTDIYDDTVQTLRNYALRGLADVTSITLTALTAFAQESISSCAALVRIEVPAIINVASHAMRDNPLLEETVMPNVESIGNYAFTSCPSFKRICYPKLKTLGPGVFYACTNVEQIELPRLETIGEYAIASCVKVQQIDLPSIKSIGRDLLYADSQATVVNIGPYITSINADAFRYKTDEFVINMAVAEGVVSGAPWGAVNATINYNVPYSGNVPMPT